MATYKVKIGLSDGGLEMRQAQGRSAVEVQEQFVSEGYFVFSVKKVTELPRLFGISRKIPARQFIVFNKEFRGLVRAGLPIVEGFDLLLKRMKEGRLRSLLESVRERLNKGESLSQAFTAFSHQIPSYYAALLHAGEQSGNLVEVLDRFIDQEQRIRKTRKKFIQAMTYPVILVTVGLVSMYIILTRAMPQFAGLYEGSGRDLPVITELVMGFSNWLVAHYRLLFGVFVVLAVVAHFYLRTPSGSRVGEWILRRIPLIGGMWKLQNQNIFSRTMRLLLDGGIPVPQALAITAGGVPSQEFRRELRRAYEDLLKGDSLQEALDRHTKLTDMVSEMVRVGEATGTLGEMFDYLGEHGEELSEDYLELVSNLVAPIMLLVVGLIIAFLVIAMYLPMFGSYGAIGG